MAPILKELEAPAGAPSSSAPVAPKVQPVALEIPVTVNGARTVDGSDKRVPFSENTQTVLVLPHGTVIRTNTPLASGQLVFLTNEKTKKEVVCQVVKSKSTGSSGSYVELQFTEPSPGFWGLQLPGSAALPPGPRPVAPASPKTVAPPAPVAVKPPAVPEAISTLPAKPVVLPPPAVIPAAPVAVKPEPPIAPVITAPPVQTPTQTAKPIPTATIPAEVHDAEPVNVVPAVPVTKAPETVEPSTPAASTSSTSTTEPAHHPLPQLPKLHNYGKEIDALFAPPRPPVASPEPESHPAPAANHPSTEDLKQQAARLQEQLSSMLFTQNQSAAPAAPVSNRATELPVTELPKPVEIAVTEVKVVQSEPKPAPPAPKSQPVSLNAEDESVKIPSWLAPITQNSAAGSTSDTATAHESSEHGASVNSEESFDALVGESSKRPETAVFGGQLLGEAAPAADAPASGSKKGLIFGLIAATVVIAGGGWYYLQNFSGRASSAAPSHSVSANSPATESSTSSAASVPEVSAPSSKGNTSPVAAQPPRNSAPAPAAAAPQPRNAKPAQKNPEPPATEEPEKTSLGEVHLAAPVVNHSENSQLDTDGLQSVSTSSVPTGSDPFGSAHHATAPLPVGGDVTPAQLVKSVPPEYPQIAKSQHVSGKVTMDAVIDAAGNVASVKVVSGPTLLHRAAMDAVKQWKYKPAILDGQPTTSHLAVTVEFRAQ
jgi:periplasmic protein TonB